MWQWGAATPQPARTECDSLSSDTDWNEPYSLPYAWEAAEVPRDLVADLVPVLGASLQLPKTIEQCTPAALLPASLRKDSPELNFQVSAKRRRITCKQESLPEFGRLLDQLQRDPTCSLLPWRATWMQRRQAYHEYELDSSEAMGLSRKSIRTQIQAHWKAAGTQEREAWAFLRMVRERLYDMSQRQGAVKVRTRIPTPSGAALPNTSLAPAPPPASAVVIGKGIGMMRTFNPAWHNELPELAHIMSDTSLSTENKIKAMQDLPALQTKFRRYEEHVQALARHFRLPTWGCSFEVSLNAAAAGRVHCHDYIGPAIDPVVCEDSVRRVIEFTENDRYWDGMRGYISVTNARGNMQPRRVKSIIGVLYYVISNKSGSLFCSASRVPFQDLQCFGSSK